VSGYWRGMGLRGCGYVVWSIREELAVRSEWAHCPWNFESPEETPAWPVAMVAHPAKQEEDGGRCSCLVWMTSLLINA
jgi:hypothetical protein